MKVSVIGLGYVGLTIAVGAANSGHDVVGYEINKELVDNLMTGKTFVPGIDAINLVELLKNKSFQPTTVAENIRDSDVVIIAVPTPLDLNKNPDFSYLINAATLVAQTLLNDALVINESTSYPGTLRNLIKPIFDRLSNFNFEFAAAPERVDPGNNYWNLKNTPRIIGGLSDLATIGAKNFYESFCDIVTTVSMPEVAEAAKLFENTFRQVNIALVNEFAKVSKKLGFSSFEAVNAAATKPFGFMPFYPGIGVGGHCIPVDPTFLTYIADKNSVPTDMIRLANKTNLNMVNYVIDEISKNMGGKLLNCKIQVAGIAYKPNVSDIRESPALELISKLNEAGANVTWFDPYVEIDLPGKSMKLDTEIEIGLIVTPHSQIDFTVWKKSGITVYDLSSSTEYFGWSKFF